MSIIAAQSIPHQGVEVLPFPEIATPELPTSILIKNFFHLLYLSIFTPNRSYYLLSKLYPSLETNLSLLKRRYPNIHYPSPDYRQVVHMLTKEKLTKDPTIKLFLDLLTPTVFSNVPAFVKPRNFNFVGFTLEGALKVIWDEKILLSNDTYNEYKQYTPLVRWFSFFIQTYIENKEYNKMNSFIQFKLNDVSSPVLPFQSHQKYEMTFVNVLMQLVKFHQLYRFKKDCTLTINDFLWRNFLFESFQGNYNILDKKSTETVIDHFVKQLTMEIIDQIPDTAYLLTCMRRMLFSSNSEKKDQNYFLGYSLSLESFIGLEDNPSSDSSANTQAKKSAKGGQSPKAVTTPDPNTQPETTSPTQDDALDNGNNTSVSMQDDEGSAQNIPIENDETTSSLTPETDAMGNSVPDGKRLEVEYAPRAVYNIPLKQVAAEYLYNQAVAKLSEKLSTESDIGVDAYTKNTLSEWCKLNLWLYPTRCTKELVNKLGLEKHLLMFHSIIKG